MLFVRSLALTALNSLHLHRHKGNLHFQLPLLKRLNQNFPHPVLCCFFNCVAMDSSRTATKLKKLNGFSIIDDIRKEYHSYHGGRFELSLDNMTGIATLKINSPERRNALSGTMMSQLTDVISELETWKEGKAVLIYGADGFFCSGGDLTTVKHIDNSEGGRRMAILMHDNLSRFQSLPMISIALVQGKALGGGAELTTACDFRLMTPEAEIGFVHIRLGVTTGWGGGVRLCQIVGPTKALELFMSGRRVTAEEALQIGLCNHIIKEGENGHDGVKDVDANGVILNKALQWVIQFTQHPAVTIGAFKGIVNAAKWHPLNDALKKEVEMFASVWGGPDHQNALTKNIKHKD